MFGHVWLNGKDTSILEKNGHIVSFLCSSLVGACSGYFLRCGVVLFGNG
jgi:hypothetical protein